MKQKVIERGCIVNDTAKLPTKFKCNGNLLVKKNDAICSQAQGSVAVQQLSLIQCYINFPIYAALVRFKAPKHFEVAVCYVCEKGREGDFSC